MDSGFYAACTALMSRMQALDSVANNLANANTTGYRAQVNNFRSVLSGVSNGSPLNNTTNAYGVLGDTQLDFSQGAIERTGNSLDFALQGPGFFVVQTPAGTAYTRSGNFKLSPTGQLVTQEGDPVMSDQGPIQLPAGTVNVSPDGTISVDGAVAGNLKIVEFPKGTQIQSLGKTYYSAPPKTAVAARSTQIQQGMIESSNVNPIATAVELVSLQRTAEMMQRTLSIFHSEFNKTATQDLPHVS
jgi:flagellar basal-body rod protein FlgF